jgi:hypothetical protein
MPPDIAHYIAENQRLNAAMAAMGGSSDNGGHFGMPVPSMPPANAYLWSTPRPRQFYCWLHGYNNTHIRWMPLQRDGRQSGVHLSNEGSHLVMGVFLSS